MSLTYQDLREAKDKLDSKLPSGITYVLPRWVHCRAYRELGQTIQFRITNSSDIPTKFRVGCVTYITAEELYRYEA